MALNLSSKKFAVLGLESSGMLLQAWMRGGLLSKDLPGPRASIRSVRPGPGGKLHIGLGTAMQMQWSVATIVFIS